MKKSKALAFSSVLVGYMRERNFIRNLGRMACFYDPKNIANVFPPDVRRFSDNPLGLDGTVTFLIPERFRGDLNG